MKIPEINQRENTIQNVNQANQAEKEKQLQGPREVKNEPSSLDKVELSAKSKEIKKINDVVEMTPDVRAEKVSELKTMIQEGRYKVDNEALAGKRIKESILDLIK